MTSHLTKVLRDALITSSKCVHKSDLGQKSERNARILDMYISEQNASNVAAAFGISATGVCYIIHKIAERHTMRTRHAALSTRLINCMANVGYDVRGKTHSEATEVAVKFYREITKFGSWRNGVSNLGPKSMAELVEFLGPLADNEEENRRIMRARQQRKDNRGTLRIRDSL